MKIAIAADESRTELMARLCAAYKPILAEHALYAPRETGARLSAETGLAFQDAGADAGLERTVRRIEWNEMDLALVFLDPDSPAYPEKIAAFISGCDKSRIPLATNSATAEVLLLALGRGDLDWRNEMA